MSNSLSSNLIKAMAGDYRLPIKAILIEAWRRLNGLKITFWGGFALLFLTMFIVCILLSLVVALYVFFVMYPHNVTSSSTGELGLLYSALNFILVGILEILRLLLTASLAYLALHHLRNQPIWASMVFSFRKAWQPLLVVGIMLYLIDVLLLSGSNFLLYHYQLTPQIFYLGFGLRFILFALLYTYITIGFFMTILLILDQQLTLKNSLRTAFKSINRHLIKNIGLIIVISFGCVLLTLVTLGIGLIWLLPMVSLVTAIQYNQIFCQGSLA